MSFFQFCIPGLHAINIYMNFINNPMDAFSEKKALLEEAPSSKVIIFDKELKLKGKGSVRLTHRHLET
jgi:hypothetical protein